MPSLSQLTDAYQQPDNTMPVEPIYTPPPKRLIMNMSQEGAPQLEAPDTRPEPLPTQSSPSILDNLGMAGVEDKSGTSENPIIKKLFGLGGEERYQLWPEKVVRSALTALPDAASGNLPTFVIDHNTGETVANPEAISRTLDMASLGGAGGLTAGADASLGSTPFLRPALKYEGKIYKAPVGGEHLDALPAHLADEFHKQAMSGEDISNFNFGFMNHKGQFLDREKALDYAIKEGLIDQHAGKYGALTSTLLADSSKPGTAIEGLAKAKTNKFKLDQIKKAFWVRDAEINGYKPAEKLESAGGNKFYIKDGDGKEVGRVAVQPSEDGKTVKIIHMQAGGDINSIGTTSIRNLKSQLKEHYPNATNIEGWRVGGANPGRTINTILADSSKPGTAIEAMAKIGQPFELSLSQRNKILEKVNAGKPVHYIDLPQSLKDKALSKGFPLFSGKYMFTPVQGDPFASNQK